MKKYKNNNFESIGRDISKAISDATKEIDTQKLKTMAEAFAKKAEDQSKKYTKKSWKEYETTNQPLIKVDKFGDPITPYKSKSIAMRFGGLAIGMPMTVGALSLIFESTMYYGELFPVLAGLFILLPIGLYSLHTAYRGFRLEAARSRFLNYWEALRERGFASIQKLSSYVNKDPKFVRREIKFMVENRFFEAGRFIGPEDTLVINRPNYLAFQKQQALEEEKTQALAQPKDNVADAVGVNATPDQVLEEARGYLVQLREAEQNIENPSMKSSVIRLERITGNIFDYVAKNPQKLNKIRKFMHYYLPTTVKLVQSYAVLEDQEVSGTNIEGSKHRIEDSMQVITESFERLLDELFQKEALDIHADLIAMETMMARDGLGGKDFIRMETNEGEDDE